MSETEQRPEARFTAFAEGERDALHWAVTGGAKRIMEDAVADRLPHDQLDGAGGLFLLLSNIARQLDLVAGKPTENMDSAIIVAQLIASGEAPQMAAEGEAAERIAQIVEEDAEILERLGGQA